MEEIPLALAKDAGVIVGASTGPWQFAALAMLLLFILGIFFLWTTFQTKIRKTERDLEQVKQDARLDVLEGKFESFNKDIKDIHARVENIDRNLFEAIHTWKTGVP